MTRLKCFMTGASAARECSQSACTDCARVVEMLAELGEPRPRDLNFRLPAHVLLAARQIAASADEISPEPPVHGS